MRRFIMARPTKRTLAPLEQLCAGDDDIDIAETLAEAISRIKAEGTQGSRQLASLIKELTDGRSARIGYALQAAAEAAPTRELIGALETVRSEPLLRPRVRGRFSAETVRGKKIGWSEQTHEKIRAQASEALQLLRSAQDANRLIYNGAVQTAVIVGLWILFGLLWAQLQ
jgi:hypothetical protein